MLNEFTLWNSILITLIWCLRLDAVQIPSMIYRVPKGMSETVEEMLFWTINKYRFLRDFELAVCRKNQYAEIFRHILEQILLSELTDWLHDCWIHGTCCADHIHRISFLWLVTLLARSYFANKQANWSARQTRKSFVNISESFQRRPTKANPHKESIILSIFKNMYSMRVASFLCSYKSAFAVQLIQTMISKEICWN